MPSTPRSTQCNVSLINRPIKNKLKLLVPVDWSDSHSLDYNPVNSAPEAGSTRSAGREVERHHKVLTLLPNLTCDCSVENLQINTLSLDPDSFHLTSLTLKWNSTGLFLHCTSLLKRIHAYMRKSDVMYEITTPIAFVHKHMRLQSRTFKIY